MCPYSSTYGQPHPGRPVGGHLRRSWRPVCFGRRALNLTAVALRPRRPLPCRMASIPLACAARYARAQVAWDRVVSLRPQGSPWRRPLARGGGGSVAMVRRWFGPQGHQGTAVVPSLVARTGAATWHVNRDGLVVAD